MKPAVLKQEKLSKYSNAFFKDVVEGLCSHPKHLNSKYFYDAAGDKLFQQIMQSDEYYLTNCEMEILQKKSGIIAETLFGNIKDFDLIELGAGDCSKSCYLLQEIITKNTDFIFYPIDISSNVINLLESELPEKINGLHVNGLNGEYLAMLKKAKTLSLKKKVILFMGSNIGNMQRQESVKFCRQLKTCLSQGDILIIGFDLKKDPQIILDAYNDKGGITKRFNLNLLTRINRELNADFNIIQFKHFPTYDPQTGTCKSFLVSTCRQTVSIDSAMVEFEENETIFMEISQKYTVQQTDEIALLSGFKPLKHFYDSKKWFLDTVWECL